MLGLIQRVTHAEVQVADEQVAQIAQGALVLVGVQPDDNQSIAKRLGDKLVNYRLFADENNKSNLSVKDIQGGLLLVPQFTLAADTQKGLRPSFSSAASPDLASELFDYLLQYCRTIHSNVEQGQFGADMLVSLTNDGPVTYLITVN